MSTSIMIKNNNNIFKDKTAKEKSVFTQIKRKKLHEYNNYKASNTIICQ